MNPKLKGIAKSMGEVAARAMGVLGEKGVHVLDLADALSCGLKDLLEEQKKTNELLEKMFDNQEEFLEIMENCAINDCKSIEEMMGVWKAIAEEKSKEDKVIEVEAKRID